MYQYKVKKIIKIIDGDTFSAELDLGFNLSYSVHIRLTDIDAPEVRTLNEDMKKYGLRAKQKLEEYLKGGDGDLLVTTLKPSSDDKYNRVLATAYKEGQNLTASEFMLANQYAWCYDGKEKETDLSKLAAL